MRSMEIDSSGSKSKKYFCLFCEKLISNYGRHVLTHKDIPEIQEIMNLPKGNKVSHFSTFLSYPIYLRRKSKKGKNNQFS